jgi:hypothetical protein
MFEFSLSLWVDQPMPRFLLSAGSFLRVVAMIGSSRYSHDGVHGA